MAAGNVWLYVPNLIGYVRVVTGMAAVAVAFQPDSIGSFFWLYGFSYLLDALDGVAARSLNQTSRFGAVLDMVTDRVCTAALLSLLAHHAASVGAGGAWLAPFYVGCMMLDVGAHWVQMYAGLSVGATSHKAIADEPALIRWYYQRHNLFTLCLLNETHLLLALLLVASKDTIAVAPFDAPAPFLRAMTDAMPSPFPSLHPGTWAAGLHALTAPAFALKQIISLMQLARSAARIVELDHAPAPAAPAAAVEAAPSAASEVASEPETDAPARIPSPAPKALSPAPRAAAPAAAATNDEEEEDEEHTGSEEEEAEPAPAPTPSKRAPTPRRASLSYLPAAPTPRQRKMMEVQAAARAPQAPPSTSKREAAPMRIRSASRGAASRTR